ncbi:hypothetical protein MNBD_PLANCTO02-1272, partial [hydrothermal vent metagenome]
MSIAFPSEIPFEESEWNHKDIKIDLELIDCTLCGSPDYKTILIERDIETGIGGSFRVVQCSDCGLVYTNPRPTPESIGLFYQDDYECYTSYKEDHSKQARWRHELEQAVLQTYYGYPAEKITLATKMKAWWGNIRISRNRQRMGWIPFRSPGRLLDFGCGAGGFLRQMQSHGWQVEGLDFSELVANQVTEETGIPVHIGTLPHPQVKPNSYDTISLWNALEHVHSPSETIQAVKEALRPGGLMVIGVPNSGSFGFETFQNDWFALKLPRHLTHFTPDSLTKLL